MGGPLERVLDLRDRVARGALPGPAILTPGPFIDGPGDADPMFRRVNTTDDARRSVRELAAAGVDFIKVQANLSREAYDAVVREARDRQKPVAGHVPVSMSASDTVGTGQRSIEHVSPALVLLDGNPLADIRNVGRIAAVIQGGRLLTRTDLDALLEAVRTAAASRAPRFQVLGPQ